MHKSSIFSPPAAVGQSDADGVGVGVGDVADPALGRAGLDRRQPEESDLQPRRGELGQLEAEADRPDLQHGGRAQSRDLQLETRQFIFRFNTMQRALNKTLKA